MNVGVISTLTRLMWVCLICFYISALPAYAQQAGEIVWEDEFVAGGGTAGTSAIPSNQTFISGGVTATLTYNVDSNSGTQTAGGFPDFISFFGGTFSGETGSALITYDSANDSSDNRLIINLTFTQPVFNLDFDLVNIDQSGAGSAFGGAVDDGLEVFFDDGVGPEQTLAQNPSLFSLSGANIILDGADGWEGNGDAGLGGASTSANLNIDFGAQPVQNLRFEIFTADDSPANPGTIIAAISDISWVDSGADLETQVSTSSFIPFIGNLVTTSVSVTNTGPEATSGVTVNASLPSGLLFDSDNGGTSYNSTTGLWTIGTLAVGETATLDIISIVQETGSYVFQSEVQSSATGDPDSTPGNGAPGEDDTDSLTLSPRDSNPTLSCNGRLIEVLTFESPQLISGGANQINSVYRYDNITSGVSANVTVTGSVNGAGLLNIDDDGPFPGDPDNEELIASFQPVLNTTGDSAVEFEFEFFFTDTNLPALVDFAASSIDVDGNGASVVEYVDYQDTFVESIFSSTTVLTEINPSPNNSNEVRFQSTTVDAATGVDRSAVDNIVTVFYTDTSNFTVTLGATGTFNGRLTSMAFDCPNIGIPVTNAVIDEDFGDAPVASYGNPVHTIVAGVLLGATNTADTASFDSPTASADAGDDGANPPDFTGKSAVEFDVDVTGAGGFLQAWVDWNIDGDFEDSGEQIISDLQDSDANNVITVSVTPPANLTPGDSFIRLRWSTTAGISSNEAVSNGEVEDYAVSLILGAPELQAVKSVAAIDGNYSIPGNDVSYTLTVSNIGATQVDEDSIFLVDNFPSDLDYVFDDANGGLPGSDEIIFTEINPTGLSFDATTDVGFSTDTAIPTDFSECNAPATPGVNENVTFICFNPKGTFLTGTPAPSFSLTFRARIK